MDYHTVCINRNEEGVHVVHMKNRKVHMAPKSEKIKLQLAKRTDKNKQGKLLVRSIYINTSRNNVHTINIHTYVLLPLK